MSNQPTIRLQKLLADAGICSRRAAEDMITSGKVMVNDQIIRELGTKVNEKKDRVFVEGVPVKRVKKFTYIMFYKPAGMVTTMSDPEGRPTVGDVIERLELRLFSIGRLDFHSEGLLLLTNDGDLSHKISHPTFKVTKRYFVKVSGFPSRQSLSRLRRGVKLEDGFTKPEKVILQGKTPQNSWLEISITEGRNRQVRRMLKAVGLSVLKLKRASFGPLELGNMKAGGLRPLELAEIKALKQAAGL